MCDAESALGGAEVDALVALAEQHDFFEATGGYTACSCGWPTREQWEAGEPPALHVLLAACSIHPAAWDAPDPDDPPATRDEDPMWGRDLPPAETEEDA